MKKALATLLVCAVVFSAFVGYGGVAFTEREEPVIVTAMIQQSRFYDGLQAMIDKLAEEENIVVDVQVVPDSEMLIRMSMKLNSGEAPDLIDYNIPAIYDIVDPAANFVDLSGETWTEKLLVPENVSYKEDGKIYGFPFFSVPVVHGFICNMDVLKLAGVEVPATWDDLLTACEIIKGAGITPIYMPQDNWVPQILMTDNIAKALGATNARELADRLISNKAKWTDIPKFAEVIDKYLALFTAGYVNEDFASATYNNAITAIAEGKAAMHFDGDFFAASVLEENPDANIGMFNISMFGEPDVVTGNMSSPGFMINKNSEKIDAAKKILELWSTPEYANLYFEGRPGFPAFEGVDGGTLPDYLNEMNEKYISVGKIIPEWNYYVMELHALFESSLYIYYKDAPVKGDMDGAAIMEKFQHDFEQYMQAQGAEGF